MALKPDFGALTPDQLEWLRAHEDANSLERDMGPEPQQLQVEPPKPQLETMSSLASSPTPVEPQKPYDPNEIKPTWNRFAGGLPSDIVGLGEGAVNTVANIGSMAASAFPAAAIGARDFLGRAVHGRDMAEPLTWPDGTTTRNPSDAAVQGFERSHKAIMENPVMKFLTEPKTDKGKEAAGWLSGVAPMTRAAQTYDQDFDITPKLEAANQYAEEAIGKPNVDFLKDTAMAALVANPFMVKAGVDKATSGLKRALGMEAGETAQQLALDAWKKATRGKGTFDKPSEMRAIANNLENHGYGEAVQNGILPGEALVHPSGLTVFVGDKMHSEIAEMARLAARDEARGAKGLIEDTLDKGWVRVATGSYDPTTGRPNNDLYIQAMENPDWKTIQRIVDINNKKRPLTSVTLEIGLEQKEIPKRTLLEAGGDVKLAFQEAAEIGQEPSIRDFLGDAAGYFGGELKNIIQAEGQKWSEELDNMFGPQKPLGKQGAIPMADNAVIYQRAMNRKLKMLPENPTEEQLDAARIASKAEMLYRATSDNYKRYEASMEGIGPEAIKDRFRMKPSNEKVAAWIFDIPAGITCKGGKDCILQCYAQVAQHQYGNTNDWRNANLWLAKHHPEALEQMLDEQLTLISKGKIPGMSKAGKKVRVHSSGDMFSQQYADMWGRLAEKHPDIEFYAYTKAEKHFDPKTLERNPNFNVLYSNVAGGKNFGDAEKLVELQKDYPDTKVCPATVGANVRCGAGCSHCMKKGAKTPLFRDHGPEGKKLLDENRDALSQLLLADDVENPWPRTQPPVAEKPAPTSMSVGSPEWQAEMARPKMADTDKINGITKGEATERLAMGDLSVLPHIEEGVKKHGSLAMQDEMINGSFSRAIKNKTVDKLKEVEDPLRQVLGLGKRYGR